MKKTIIPLQYFLLALLCLAGCEKKEITTPVSSITISPVAVSLSLGDTVTLQVAVLPENADNKAVTWSTDNNAIASINDTGKVTALSVGTATITATSGDGGITASCVITVTPIAVTGIVIHPENASLMVGETITVTTAVSPEKATNKTVIWNSSHPHIATITDGQVTALAEGAATLTVTTEDGGYTASCYLTVTTALEISMITIKSSLSTVIGGSGKATISWGDGNTQEYILTGSDQVISHNYTSAGNHTITIIGANITKLDCYGGQLTSLDISRNPVLTSLLCNNNMLTTLDISHNPALGILNCSENRLEIIDADSNPALTHLFCYNNQITSIDVSGCPALGTLDCYGNQLTALDVHHNTQLREIGCGANLLSDIGLNDLFGTLHENTIGNSKVIAIGENPGTDTCNQSIATDKGWTVFAE